MLAASQAPGGARKVQADRGSAEQCGSARGSRPSPQPWWLASTALREL